MMVAGVVVGFRPFATGHYEWTAYAPLSETTFSPGVTLDRLGIAALVVAAVGLALLAGAVGYALGSRQRKGPPPPAHA
jgi:heme/copper-type cytochrome/quinol oxidase subunit 1